MMDRGLLIDLDGVLYQGDRIIPGAREAIRWIIQRQIPHVFITNTTSRPRKSIVEKLSAFGILAAENEILTPPIAACKWLEQHAFGPTKLFVPKTTLNDFASIPQFEPNSKGVAAVVFGDCGESWTFASLNDGFNLLMENPQAVLVALGMTRYWRASERLQLDVGPFVKAMEYATGREAVVLGKPSEQFFNAALQMMNCQPDNATMIGDDIIGDIRGAQRVGIRGVLVRTGKFRSSDLGGDVHPDAVIASIANLPEIWE